MWKPNVCQAFGWYGLVSACACAFQCGWCGCSVVGLGSVGVTLGIFLVLCVLCCVGGSDSACWQELMDDGISSRYIFLFMLLLISFLVIGLSIKALCYSPPQMLTVSGGDYSGVEQVAREPLILASSGTK